MNSTPKERSFLQIFLIISLAFHLVVLYLIPFVMPTQARKSPLEGEGPYQLVDFIQFEPEEGETQSKTSKIAPKDEKTVKEETETQEAKEPDIKKPTPEPKPTEQKSQMEKGPEEQNKPASSTITKPAPETQTPDPQHKTTPKPETTQSTPKPTTPESPKPQPNPEPAKTDHSEVVTSTNSDKVLEVAEEPEKSKEPKPGESEEKSNEPEKDASSPTTSTQTSPSTPAETGQPAESPEPEPEKKPALPTDPAETVAKFAKPVYPKNAANEKVEGIVELLISVEASGRIKEVKLAKSSGDKRLDDVSLNTVKRGWSFNTYPYPYTIALQVVYKTGDVVVNFGELKFAE